MWKIGFFVIRCADCDLDRILHSLSQQESHQPTLASTPERFGEEEEMV